jgi:hypothetical protein
MVPPKLGDLWEPNIYVTIGKITWPVLSKEVHGALSKEEGGTKELPS